MVQVTQTEEDIKIIIELNRLVTRKPDVVLLPLYLKFNNPPIFFERHLTQEIDEMSSFCRIFKNEARIVLMKKAKGIWPELFQKLSKEELMQKRLEIAEQLVERNKERDQKALERYETKRRAEIEKEVKRETAMRERVKQFQENACREALMVGTRMEQHEKPKLEPRSNTGSPQNQQRQHANNTYAAAGNGHGNGGRLGTPVARPAMAAVRGSGRINVAFSSGHKLTTPKRESQEGITLPFTVNGKCETLNEERDQSLTPTIDSSLEE